MAFSAIIERDPDRLAAALGVAALASMPAADDWRASHRIEPRNAIPLLRMLPGGALALESFTLSPHVVKKRDVAGDMVTEPLLGKEHALVVLQGFSEWLSVMRLLQTGLFPAHELHCAYNRYQSRSAHGPEGLLSADRLVLANFAPHGTGLMLVPVLVAPGRGEAVIVSDDPSEDLQDLGASLVPATLTRDAAWHWLDTDGADAVDFPAVLADAGPSSDLSLWLYKAA